MIKEDGVEYLIGRKLTEKELRTIEWLNGWEEETSSTIARLILAAYQNGEREAKAINHI